MAWTLETGASRTSVQSVGGDQCDIRQNSIRDPHLAVCLSGGSCFGISRR